MSQQFFPPVTALSLAILFAVQLEPHGPKAAIAEGPAPGSDISELWEAPVDLAREDLLNGSWDTTHSPDPHAIFTFARLKRRGVNPGVVVTDPLGRRWHVKQRGRNDAGAEGPVEVFLSRVLSAVGYHQPPMYFLPSFTLDNGPGRRRQVAPGGRFRLDDPSLKSLGEWSWQENPFLGSRPFNGLIVILLLFNSSDLKNSNNTLYEATWNGHHGPWYVVRDLGSALGESGRIAPRGNDPAMYDRAVFIRGVRDGFVEFGNRGRHQEVFQHRITTADVGWAAQLLGRLNDRQWHEAFQAAGYSADVADRFLRTIRRNIARALEIADPQ